MVEKEDLSREWYCGGNSTASGRDVDNCFEGFVSYTPNGDGTYTIQVPEGDDVVVNQHCSLNAAGDTVALCGVNVVSADAGGTTAGENCAFCDTTFSNGCSALGCEIVNNEARCVSAQCAGHAAACDALKGDPVGFQNAGCCGA